jgi:hypothetical protein
MSLTYKKTTRRHYLVTNIHHSYFLRQTSRGDYEMVGCPTQGTPFETLTESMAAITDNEDVRNLGFDRVIDAILTVEFQMVDME